MLAGRRAFVGETATDKMTAILTDEPPEIPVAARSVTPALEGIVRRCLDKRPDARFQSASDLSFALELLGNSSSDSSPSRPAAPPRATHLRWLLGAATIVIAAALGATAARRFALPTTEMTRATFIDISGTSIPVPSEDGRQLAFVIDDKQGTRIWIGSLDRPGRNPIPGTEGVTGIPYWSPDGHRLGFAAGQQLKTVDLTTGAVENVAAVPDAAIGAQFGALNDHGDIIFNHRGIFQVRPSGGAPIPLVMPDLYQGDYFLGFPQFLPDGQHYLFSVGRRGGDPGDAQVGRLGSQERKTILQTDSAATYASGHLLFTRGGGLFAQVFDPNRLALSGHPELLLDGLTTSRSFFGGSRVVASRRTLYFTSEVATRSQLTWFDRAGHASARLEDPLEALAFDVTGNGATAVILLGLPGELWKMDTQGGGLSRLTNGADDADPRLSADGTSVLFGGTYNGRRGLDIVRVEGASRRRVYEPSGAEDPLKDPLARLMLHDWSRDGRFALCDLTGRHREISAVTLSNGHVEAALRSVKADQARFSPDGKWIAYNAFESGRTQVFVVPFPPTGERWQISPSGGVQPEWRGDGRELFYLDTTNALMAVDIRSQSGFAAGPPRRLFQTPLEGSDEIEEYRVTADGQRFLLRVPVGGPTRTTLVLNWPALLKQ
jgi:Tol biopolymer transport system component